MPDEPTSPASALRLKPRLRPAEGEVPVPAPLPAPAPVPASPLRPAESDGPAAAGASAGASALPKIRLRPRMQAKSDGTGGGEPLGDPATRPLQATVAPESPSAVPLDSPAVLLPAPVPAQALASGPVQAASSSSDADSARATLFVAEAHVPAVASGPALVSPSLSTGSLVEGGKFKLKTNPPPAGSPPGVSDLPLHPAPRAAEPRPAELGPKHPPAPGHLASRMPGGPVATATLLPFPVIAPDASAPATGAPPMPAMPVPEEALAPTLENAIGGRRRRFTKPMMGLAAALGLGATYLVWQHGVTVTLPPPAPLTTSGPKVTAAEAPTPRAATLPAPATPATATSAELVVSTTPTATASPTAAAGASLTPSETLNSLAHVPADSVQKARQVIAARNASGQVLAEGSAAAAEIWEKPASPPSAVAEAPVAAAAGKSAMAMTTVAPGLSASIPVEAATEASAAFRTFVANAKVSGVFQGSPSRAFINGRLSRVGDIVDPALGVIFDGVATDRRQLVFKDKTGATVARKY